MSFVSDGSNQMGVRSINGHSFHQTSVIANADEFLLASSDGVLSVSIPDPSGTLIALDAQSLDYLGRSLHWLIGRRSRYPNRMNRTDPKTMHAGDPTGEPMKVPT